MKEIIFKRNIFSSIPYKGHFQKEKIKHQSLIKSLYIRTFGCQMNTYDSEKIVDILRESANLNLTNKPEEADLIILNTCSIREKAQEKVFSDLGRIKKLKDKKPSLIIAVGGCVASQEGNYIIKRAPYVDIVFGPQTLHRLPELIKKYETSNSSQIDISFPEIEKFDAMPLPKKNGPSAFVSIMEGCSKYCSFCVVPYTRGTEISRSFEDVLLEVADLADQGVKEVTLLGQNVNAYRSLLPNSNEYADFSTLIEYVHEIPGIERIRYTTSHPKEMTTRISKIYSKLPKLVSFLHLPVQSGSDKILSAMKRGYTVSEFKSVIHRLQDSRPNLSFSSDFIVGFPGETEDDFQETIKLIEEIGFDTSFSFIYSPRPGTPAAEIPDNVPNEVKFRRLQILQSLIKQQASKIVESMIGSTQRLLVEGVFQTDSSKLVGRTENNRIVIFEAPSNLVGKLVNVTIIKKNHYLEAIYLD
ncbi:MAG: tRNA (N6-isopentenyl adenosine(37)-C2)-methylthiotransferase MiaB [Bordetella sp.]|nr:MAG: tRNA (N6-isopentenyl adenosine(37)-C2)-methylthiotransferase MiaB [Bordetella sp.]